MRAIYTLHTSSHTYSHSSQSKNTREATMSSHHAQLSAGNSWGLMQHNSQHMLFVLASSKSRQGRAMWNKEGCPDIS